MGVSSGDVSETRAVRSVLIESATIQDKQWIEFLFRREKSLGANFGSIWYRFWHAGASNEYWHVIRPYAFIHWRHKRDDWRVVYEIAVDPAMRRQGYARALMQFVGAPCMLKTDELNQTSRLFYERLGFVATARLLTKKGDKSMITYCLWEMPRGE